MKPRTDRWLLSLVVAACFPLAAVAQAADTGGNVNIDLHGPGGGVHVDVHDQGDATAAGVHVRAGAHQEVRVDRPGEAYRLTYDADARGRTAFKVVSPRGLRVRVTRRHHTVVRGTLPVRFAARGGAFYRIRIYGPNGKIFDERLQARAGEIARLRVRPGAPAGGQVSVNAGGPGGGQVAVNAGGGVTVHAGAGVRVHTGAGAAGGVDVDVGADAPPPPAPAPAPVAAPPPPAPAPACMSDGDLASLEQALSAEDFSEGKLTVLGDFARGHAFCVAQVVTVLGKLDFSEGKLKALRIMKPEIVDPQNDFRIYQAFDFEADKAKARKILAP